MHPSAVTSVAAHRRPVVVWYPLAYTCPLQGVSWRLPSGNAGYITSYNLLCRQHVPPLTFFLYLRPHWLSHLPHSSAGTFLKKQLGHTFLNIFFSLIISFHFLTPPPLFSSFFFLPPKCHSRRVAALHSHPPNLCKPPAFCSVMFQVH